MLRTSVYVCSAFLDIFYTHTRIYRPIYQTIGFLNHQIFASVSSLKILYLSGSTSYLTNWTFQVTWNSSLSKLCFLETGVPQGSVSGPVLFYYTLDHWALQSHHMDCLTTVMLMTPNCSSLFPHPPPTPML